MTVASKLLCQVETCTEPACKQYGTCIQATHARQARQSCRTIAQPDSEVLLQENTRLRRLVAKLSGGQTLKVTLTELVDESMQPTIDFLHDAPETIGEKLALRKIAKLKQKGADERKAYSGQLSGSYLDEYCPHHPTERLYYAAFQPLYRSEDARAMHGKASSIVHLKTCLACTRGAHRADDAPLLFPAPIEPKQVQSSPAKDQATATFQFSAPLGVTSNLGQAAERMPGTVMTIDADLEAPAQHRAQAQEPGPSRVSGTAVAMGDGEVKVSFALWGATGEYSFCYTFVPLTDYLRRHYESGTLGTLDPDDAQFSGRTIIVVSLSNRERNCVTLSTKELMPSTEYLLVFFTRSRSTLGWGSRSNLDGGVVHTPPQLPAATLEVEAKVRDLEIRRSPIRLTVTTLSLPRVAISEKQEVTLLYDCDLEFETAWLMLVAVPLSCHTDIVKAPPRDYLLRRVRDGARQWLTQVSEGANMFAVPRIALQPATTYQLLFGLVEAREADPNVQPWCSNVLSVLVTTPPERTDVVEGVTGDH